MKITRNNKSGYSLLEFVMTIPLSMLFLFGVTDLMRVLSAQTAIDSGTESALRCLSPIDGACSTSKKDSYTRKYDVYSSVKAKKYLYDTYSFSATANTISANVYEAQANANVLGSGYAIVKPFKTTFKELGFPSKVQAKYYMMTKSLPFVDGTHQYLQNQKFLLKNERDTAYRPKVKIDKTFSLKMARNQTEADSSHDVTFTIEADKSCDNKLPCFVSTKVDTSNASYSQANFRKKCETGAFGWVDGASYNPTNKELTYSSMPNSNMACKTTPIVLFIKGTSSIQGDDSAQVLIDLYNENGKLVRALGGRVFKNDSSASLVARGAEVSNYSDDLKEEYGKKELTYHQAIQVNYNKTYSIRFRLKRIGTNNTADVSWKFEELKIFTPEFVLKEIESDCENPILKSENKKQQLQRCEPKDVDSKVFSDLGYDFITTGAPLPISDSKEFQSNCSLTKEDISDVLVKNDIDESFKNYFEESEPEPCGETKEIKYDCPKNYGTKDKSEYASICPINISKEYYDFTSYFPPQSTGRYDIKNVDLGKTTFTKTSCKDETKNFLNSDWNKYKDLRLTTNKTNRTENINLSNNKYCDNLDVKDYQCDGFNVKSTQVVPTKDTQFQTLLFGKHEGVKCAWQGDGWKDILYNEITSNWDEYKDNKSCFSMNMNFAGKGKSDNAPNDSCIEFNISYTNVSDKQYEGNFSEDNIPQSCKDSNRTCEYVFTGFEGNAASNSNLSKEKDLQKADEVAFNNIQKLFPNARTGNCEQEIYCTSFESKETNKDVLFTSKIMVPIYTLLGKKIELTSSSYREKERL